MRVKFDSENSANLFWEAVDWLSRNRTRLDDWLTVPQEIGPMVEALVESGAEVDPGPEYAQKPLLIDVEKIHWADLVLRDANGNRLPTEKRIAKLLEFRRTGGILDVAFDPVGAEHEVPNDCSTWGPQTPNDVDWSGFPVEIATITDDDGETIHLYLMADGEDSEGRPVYRWRENAPDGADTEVSASNVEDAKEAALQAWSNAVGWDLMADWI